MAMYPAAAEEAKRLGVDPSHGLNTAAVKTSRNAHGANQLPEVKARTIREMFIAALMDKTLLILLAASALALGVEFIQGMADASYSPHYFDGVGIFLAVLIASLVTTFNEARAARQFRLLNRQRADVPVKVMRDGAVHQISILDLVVGDVVIVGAGDRLPADGILLEGSEVEVDESTLTGESVAAPKGGDELNLLGGTSVTVGSGRMLVRAVGAATEIGKLQLSLTEEPDEQTPLQERLSKLADRIGIFGLGAAIITFLALAISQYARGELGVDVDGLRQVLSFAIIAVTIVVVAVPEGLPLAVTISLAYSVRKMAKDNNLVRRLNSCETMGAATVVCSDKTGTLTENRMSVVAVRVGESIFEQAPAASDVDDDLAELVAELVAVNSTAFLEDVDGRTEYVGNPTEGALLGWTRAWGATYVDRRESSDVTRQFGFSSDRKRMSTVVAGKRLLVKGAPEVVIDRCVNLRTAQGTKPLDEALKSQLREELESWSGEGYRTLALARREVDASLGDNAADWEIDLELVALVAIADPVRAEVKGAIEACRGAGVEVKMVTGDNRLTAKSISRQIGLLDDDELVMEGDEFREKSDDELKPLLSKLKVLARSVPSDKHRLVTLLKQSGEVVAVTGDGTNDAPALKAADVGFSMGKAGTEVAKEASDIVLLDDNFASIVNGILWGRSIFENIRKFLQFQLTVNVVALSTAFLAAVFGFGIPLNTVQLLWVNLIMDTLAALALATEPPDERFFKQPPHGRHAPLITPHMWLHILATGGVMLTVLLSILFTDILIGGVDQATRYTFLFNCFVLMQLFNEWNARSTRFDRGVLRNLGRSHLFIGVMVTTFVLQVLIVQYGGVFFRTVPLNLSQWILSIVVGASMLAWGAALRSVGARAMNAPAAVTGH